MGVGKGNWHLNQKEVDAKTQNLNSDGFVSRVMVLPLVNGADGSTSGWVKTAGLADTPTIDLPQSETSAEWLVPITGLSVGEKISSVRFFGQADSAGNAVSCQAQIFVATPDADGIGAGDLINIDGPDTIVDATEDTAIDATLTFASEHTVASGEIIWIRLTGTTAATTDIELTTAEVAVV